MIVEIKPFDLGVNDAYVADTYTDSGFFQTSAGVYFVNKQMGIVNYVCGGAELDCLSELKSDDVVVDIDSNAVLQENNVSSFTEDFVIRLSETLTRKQ